ncbi:MAG: response regulator [Dehalococcoidia bacterium]|nr:response regulator [Dehalococcoidia bacterium]
MPDSPEARVPPTSATPPPEPSITGRALAVDPDAGVRRVIALVLEELGFVTHAVADAESALELLPTLNPHLVITEVRLPGMSGPDLVRAIRALPHKAPHILLMSAYPRPGHSGETVFMPKPLHFERLLQVARDALSG